MKKYKVKQNWYSIDIVKEFENHSTCPECSYKCIFDKDRDSNWTWFYKCPSCNSKFEYIPTDMGQTLPALKKL